MANVVTFPPRPSPSRADRADPGASATIIIFPGVRYERTAAAANGRRAKLRNDHPKGSEKAAT